jgi:23S rRNA pseudouridine1911/1915/1917 synthase
VVNPAGARVYRFEAGADDEGGRLDAFLAMRLSREVDASFTRARVQKLIDDGLARVDGKAAKASRRLEAGAVAEISVPPPKPIALLAEDIPLDVLYEDDHVVVVDKPAGLAAHPGAGRDTGTLVNALLAHCLSLPQGLSGVGGELRPGIVHRLDKDTTGVLVAAKTDLAHQSLSRQFHDHTVDRRYRALVWGAFPATLDVDARLGRDPRDRKRFTVVTGDSGRHAVTHASLVERLGAASLVECRLETGRTHQIRVHLSHEGFPLVGDALYGRKTPELAKPLREAVSRVSRQMLHAASLAFDHPASGERLRFETPLPADMAALLDAFRGRA